MKHSSSHVRSSQAPRELVHRSDDSEVFVTRPERSDGTHHVNYVLLPRPGNRYYYDGQDDPTYDPLFLAEAMRQAAMSGAHEFAGLAVDTSMFFLAMSMSIEPPITYPADGYGPVEAPRILTHLRHVKLTRAGAPRHIEYVQTASLNGSPLATSTVTVQGAPRAKYHDMRTYQRQGRPAPRTDEQPARQAAGTAPPNEVGRSDPSNVVLSELRSVGNTTTALLAPDYTNPSLFDHDYDHIPGMVLLEAARQMLYAAGHSSISQRGFSARFESFAELDSPLLIEHQLDDATDAATIRFTQDGHPVAVVTAPPRSTDQGAQ